MLALSYTNLWEKVKKYMHRRMEYPNMIEKLPIVLCVINIQKIVSKITAVC